MTTETPTRPPLTPFSLELLLGRIAHEWETRQRIFDLPIARFFDVADGPDLTADFMGRPAATPIGPAAGPHSQLAENIVLAWLGGSRIIELKTVQILDELDIARPCIDMQTIGFNIEWSQELKIAQSLEEYVKAWMMITILGGWDELTPYIGADQGPLVFDLSVGYDLAGISSDPVAGYIDAMMDARAEIDRLRPSIPEPFTSWRDHDFDPHIADTVTLSTFHGCPPNEIESITKHLMTRHGLDVVVKLNPTLLGFEKVQHIVRDELGYDEITVRREDFDADLQHDRGVELIGELNDFAADHGRRFGIKLTNTLVVKNHKGWMPDDPMYLSGPPLHVVTTSLLADLHAALPGLLSVDGQDAPIQVSFSAGISRDNLAPAAGLGLTPITVSSDLLKPGGYGRLKPMLKALHKEMEAASCADLPSWVAHNVAAARDAGFSGAVEQYASSLHDPVLGEPYRKEANSKLPREVDHQLEMWDCVACNFCVTVCPNDAFFRLPTPEDSELEARQQYYVLVELCNECGNCMTFCPEEGDPAIIKPRLFIDPERFAGEPDDVQAFLVTRDDAGYAATPKPGFESEVPRLVALLNEAEGFPARPSDLGS
jgi:putative selenate reductase